MAVRRILVVWLLTAVTLLVLSALLSGVEVKDFGAALGSALLIGLLNALLWPLVIRIALPLTVLTLGLGAILLNGAMILLVAAIDPGLKISGLFAGVVVALSVTVVTTGVTSLLAIDDDPFWYRNVVRRQARRVGEATASDVPGLFFLEIDGLAHDVRCATETLPTWRAGCAGTRTGCSAGRPTGPRRRGPARPACCTETTTTCRPSAGGRRTATRRS